MANILVYVETRKDSIHPMSLEAVALGRRLASRLGATLYTVIPCAQPPAYGEEDVIVQVSRAGTDKVILLAHPCLEGPGTFETHGRAVLSACRRFPPSVLVCPDTSSGRDVAAGCAASLDASFFWQPEIPEEVETAPVRQADPLGGGARQVLLPSAERTVVIVTGGESGPFEAGDEAEVVVLPANCGDQAPIRLTDERQGDDQEGAGWRRAESENLLLLAEPVGDVPRWRKVAERLGLELRFAAVSRWGKGSFDPRMVYDPAAELGRASRVLVVGGPGVGSLVRALPASWEVVWAGGSAELAGRASWVAMPPDGFLEALERRLDLPGAGGPDPESEPGGGQTDLTTASGTPAGAESGEPEGGSPATQPGTMLLLAGPFRRGVPAGLVWDGLSGAVALAKSLHAARRVVLTFSERDVPIPRALRGWDVVRVAPASQGEVGVRGLARMLAGAVEKVGADVVLSGIRGLRWGRGLLPAAVAVKLGWPYLGSVVAARATEEGLVADTWWNARSWKWKVEQPVVLAVAPLWEGEVLGEVEDREAEVWEIEDLGLSKQDVLPLMRPLYEVDDGGDGTGRALSVEEILEWLEP